MSFLRSLASLAALVGALALLLADDAGPQCTAVTFNRTLTVSSPSCGGLSETVQITLPGGGDTGTSWDATVQHVSGDTFVTAAHLRGTCVEDNRPVNYNDVDIEADLGSFGGQSCAVALGTFAVECSNTTCPLTVTAVQ